LGDVVAIVGGLMESFGDHGHKAVTFQQAAVPFFAGFALIYSMNGGSHHLIADNASAARRDAKIQRAQPEDHFKHNLQCVAGLDRIPPNKSSARKAVCILHSIGFLLKG
jgi:hypothetical protein